MKLTLQTTTTAPNASRPLLQGVERTLGFVPNMIGVIGNSPAALEGYLNFSGALAKGSLSHKLREQIALATAEINGCGYCLSAHTLLGGKAGLGTEEITAARQANAEDVKSDAALKLARAVITKRGKINDEELQAAKAANLTDGEIIEVVSHVALNILTNYTNNLVQTDIDFPVVKPGVYQNATCTTESCACSH
jgi:uncharacterized peroxidase-related enzyme